MDQKVTRKARLIMFQVTFVRISSEVLFRPKMHVFSAVEFLLRIYQNPIHLNMVRWRTRFLDAV